ncbi:MAG TPA: universal stress protein, partial [Solirubrobacteraceae bacterium]|nr:universal stress protein [Solirubrobacteraceae bacterium]
MPDTILVGIDTRRRQDARDAIALAVRLASIAGAELLAVTVVAPSRGLDTAQHEAELTREIMSVAGRIGVTPPFEARAIQATSPARGLHELVGRMSAVALVIGPSLPDPDRGWMAGSVADLLLHGSASPVVIAPSGYFDRAGDPLGVVGVGFTASAEGRAALRGAQEIAARADADLRVITVAEPFLFSHIAMGREHEGLDVERALMQDARAALEAAVSALPTELRADARLLEGSPVATLRRLSGELDLLVLGSRSYGPPHVVLLGPVSRELVRSAACPVMVMPRASGPERAAAAAGGVPVSIDQHA